VGEAFDKTAKIMNLGFPGGPAVEKMAAQCADGAAALKRFPLPKPLYGQEGCNFSFSGLKTAVRRMADGLQDADKPALCFAFQETVAAILTDRTKHAVEAYLKILNKPQDKTEVTSPVCHMDAPAPQGALVVAGGVAANRRIRAALENLAASNGIRFIAPPLALCTDNAAMIAWAGLERLQRGLADATDFPVHARWPLDPDAPVVSAKSQKV
jgi:N6-L-threonylcarbamoyladenine synthase